MTLIVEQQGLPINLNLFGETGSIPVTPLFTPISCVDHMFAVWADVTVTTPGTAGSLTVSINYTNGTTASGGATLTSPSINLTSIGEQGFLLGVLHSVPNQPINYSTNALNVAGNPVYALRLRLQCLG